MMPVRSAVTLRGFSKGLFVTALLSAVVATGGCSEAEHASSAAPALGGGVPGVSGPSSQRESTAAPRIVVLGDSLTAGLGLDVDQAYPALLQERLGAEGYDVEVINAGVSGDTSAGGLRRLDWALEGDVRVLVLALGANDGLRGLPVLEMKKNLRTIIERAKARRIEVVLTGMEAPPNFGVEYTTDFRKGFSDLAREQRVQFVPFLLEGVAGDPGLNQRDGIHPNADGARRVSELVWPALEAVLQATRASAVEPAS